MDFGHRMTQGFRCLYRFYVVFHQLPGIRLMADGMSTFTCQATYSAKQSASSTSAPCPYLSILFGLLWISNLVEQDVILMHQVNFGMFQWSGPHSTLVPWLINKSLYIIIYIHTYNYIYIHTYNYIYIHTYNYIYSRISGPCMSKRSDQSPVSPLIFDIHWFTRGLGSFRWTEVLGVFGMATCSRCSPGATWQAATFERGISTFARLGWENLWMSWGILMNFVCPKLSTYSFCGHGKRAWHRLMKRSV